MVKNNQSESGNLLLLIGFMPLLLQSCYSCGRSSGLAEGIKQERERNPYSWKETINDGLGAGTREIMDLDRDGNPDVIITTAVSSNYSAPRQDGIVVKEGYKELLILKRMLSQEELGRVEIGYPEYFDKFKIKD